MNVNNLLASAQRMLRNKNTVTIIGVVAILILLYIGYSSQINGAVKPVSVPVAAQTIQPRTQITKDMVITVDMPSISISDNVITNINSVVGRYSNVNTVIPEGSMFYKDVIVAEENLPDSVFYKVKEGEIAYNFPVTIKTTYGNSILPGNAIDIYMKTGNGTEEKVMLGKLVENITVLAVKDNAGKNVFENTEETRTPSMMIFGLPEDIYLLMMKASYLSSIGVELYPVPHGGVVNAEDLQGTTEVSTEQLKDYIEAYSVLISTASDSTTVSDKLMPTVSYSGGSATITYPVGCGTDYTCYYSKDNGASKTVTKSKQTVKFTKDGTLAVSVIETNGTAHNDIYTINFANGTATSSLATSNNDANNTTTDTTTTDNGTR